MAPPIQSKNIISLMEKNELEYLREILILMSMIVHYFLNQIAEEEDKEWASGFEEPSDDEYSDDDYSDDDYVRDTFYTPSRMSKKVGKGKTFKSCNRKTSRMFRDKKRANERRSRKYLERSRSHLHSDRDWGEKKKQDEEDNMMPIDDSDIEQQIQDVDIEQQIQDLIMRQEEREQDRQIRYQLYPRLFNHCNWECDCESCIPLDWFNNHLRSVEKLTANW